MTRESAVRYLEYSLKDYSLRTAAWLPRSQVFAQNAPVLDYLLVGVLSAIDIVCDECWKMLYGEESDGLDIYPDNASAQHDHM